MRTSFPITDRLFLAACAALLLTPLGLTQWRNQEVLKTELRTQADWPALPVSLEAWKRFPGRVDQALQDRIGLRAKAREAWACLHYFGLRESVDRRVVLGSEPWLFYAVKQEPPVGFEDEIADATGTRPIREKTVRLVLEKLQNRHRWARAQGLPYLFVAVPNKTTVYREQGPDWMQAQRPDQPMAQLREAFRLAHGEDHPWLDLESALRSHREPDNIYFHTDTHWNELGAFYGVAAILEKLAADFPGLRQPTLDDFDVQWHTWGGLDLGRMLGMHTHLKEHRPGLLPKANLELPEFQREMKVLVYHDSFGAVLPHIWKAYFPNTEFHLYQRFDRKEIESDQASLVISILVERTLRDLRAY